MTQQEYTPYGEEWKKEMAKLPKAVIIDIAANLGASTGLLDDFAKAAMQGMLASGNAFDELRLDQGGHLAKCAYDIAEAMMNERERRIKG